MKDRLGTRMRWLGLCFLTGSILGMGSPQQQPPRAKLASPRGAVISRYCAACHNEQTRQGGLAFSHLNPDRAEDQPEVWERVVRKLRARYMPPAGLPRPDEKTYETVVGYLEERLDQAAVAHPNPGRTDTFRRLTRTEYQNSVRDLLGIDVDVRSLLPADETSQGFDNITVGELSPTLLDRYLAAAQKISQLAVGSPIHSPGGETFTLPPDLTQESESNELPFGTRGGAAVPYTFPLDAEYEIQVRLARDRDSHVEGLNDPQQLELTLDGERISLFSLKPPAPDLPDHYQIDQDLHVRVPVKAGPHVIGATFVKKTSALLETELQPYQVHFNMDRHPRIQAAVYTVSVLGPYNPSGPGDTPSRRRIFVCRPRNAGEEDACATKILTKLAQRAYRRRVTGADLSAPLRFYRAEKGESGFDGGIETALRAILVSPHFLFRIEKDPPGVAPHTAYSISDLELATRLSFFLWSSIPDDDLLQAAMQGKLKDPGVVQRQVKRMLADPRSGTLVTSFADQWLFLRNLQFAVPDPRLFPDFGDNLRQAFRRETELFVESILREDRSVVDLLRARYSFLDERLAKHYGIPNIYGSRFRRVEFAPGDHRSGLLSQGSVLTVTSYATRTSPVIRGKWILSNILGMPPPPPPPEVPPLKPSTVDGKFVTVRDRLAQHRSNAACASCHRLMDPLGFALENYDAVGRWRTEEGGVPVDTSGSLPDGREFDGVAGLREALVSQPDLFVFNVTEKLLTYALGRGLEPSDAPAVRQVVRSARHDDFRFSSLILGIASSPPFQMRRSQ